MGCLTGKTCVGGVLFRRRYRAAGGELNGQYLLNKVSLNRNAHRTMLGTDWLMSRGSQEPKPVLSQEPVVQDAIIL